MKGLLFVWSTMGNCTYILTPSLRHAQHVIKHISRSRKCPEPELIQIFLQQNTEFSDVINADSRVCYACYKAHLLIIKHMQNTITSTDADLSSSTTLQKQMGCFNPAWLSQLQLYCQAMYLQADKLTTTSLKFQAEW